MKSLPLVPLLQAAAALCNGCLLYALHRDPATMLFPGFLPPRLAAQVLAWAAPVRLAGRERGTWLGCGHLPDLLWAFALGCVCRALLAAAGRAERRLVWGGAAALCGGFEMWQGVSGCGTADWADVLAYWAGLGLSAMAPLTILFSPTKLSCKIF